MNEIQDDQLDAMLTSGLRRELDPSLGSASAGFRRHLRAARDAGTDAPAIRIDAEPGPMPRRMFLGIPLFRPSASALRVAAAVLIAGGVGYMLAGRGNAPEPGVGTTGNASLLVPAPSAPATTPRPVTLSPDAQEVKTEWRMKPLSSDMINKDGRPARRIKYEVTEIRRYFDPTLNAYVTQEMPPREETRIVEYLLPPQ